MLSNRLKSFRCAWKGMVLLSKEPNARIHLIAAIMSVAAGLFFHISGWEWCVVMLAIAAVLAAEAFNTALEYLTDLACPNPHPLAGKAKDLAAAAVLITAIGALGVGAVIFLPRIISMIFWLGTVFPYPE